MNEMTLTTVYDTVLEANNVFMARYRKGEAARMAELYTEDGQVLPPNADFVTGGAEIQALWQGLLED